MHNVDKWFEKRKYQSIQLFPFYSGFLMSEGYIIKFTIIFFLLLLFYSSLWSTFPRFFTRGHSWHSWSLVVTRVDERVGENLEWNIQQI